MMTSFKHRHDVWVAQSSRELGFLGKPRLEVRMGVNPSQQKFQGHNPTERALPGLINHTHAAMRDHFQQIVVANRGNTSSRSWNILEHERL